MVVNASQYHLRRFYKCQSDVAYAGIPCFCNPLDLLNELTARDLCRANSLLSVRCNGRVFCRIIEWISTVMTLVSYISTHDDGIDVPYSNMIYAVCNARNA